MRTQIPSLAALAAVALMSMGATGFAATYHKPMHTQGLTMHKRIGCADGRTILHDHGYNRIRAVDCRGGTYAYLGHRHGSTFRVLVNAHTGKILKVRTV
jgi:hypothetical protein